MSGGDEEVLPLTEASFLEEEPEAPGEEGESEARFDRALVTFRAGTLWFGIDASQVQAIADWTDLTWLPRSPPHLLGLMNLSGYPIPVMDLVQFLGLREAPALDEQFFPRIVVASARQMRVGLRADQVMGVLEAYTAPLRPLQLTQSASVVGVSLGELHGPPGRITVLDLPGLLERARVQ